MNAVFDGWIIPKRVITAFIVVLSLMLLIVCSPPMPRVKLPARIGPLELTRQVILPPNHEKHLRQTVVGFYGGITDSNLLQVYIYDNINAAFAACFTKSMSFAQVRSGASEVRFLYDRKNVIHLARKERGYYRQIFREGEIVVLWQVRDSLAEATENEILQLSFK